MTSRIRKVHGMWMLAVLIGLSAGSGLAAEFGTGSVSGTVEFEGDAPGAAAIKMDADPYCKVQHPDGASSADIVVADGGLKWVFVYVKEGLAETKYETPTESVVLDQKGCQYDPQVFGIMVGQRLEILNSDETLHNVHALPENSRQFNLAMPRPGMKLKKKFKKPEVMVRIKCDVHPWMETWAGVLAHPFYAVTGDDGGFKIDRLPAGTYVIEAWHSKLGTQTQEVTVGDAESKIEFTFKAATD